MSKNNKNENKLKDKRVLIIQIGLIGVVFGLLIFVMLTKDDKNFEFHCKDAICNDDNSVCRNYSVDDDGNTVTTWVGSCKK